jgi:hypothetical protein
MSDASLNLSNESPASTRAPSPDNNELPPPFEAPAPTQEGSPPPSFPLSVALSEASSRYPPVSPGTATRVFNNAWASYGPPDQPLSAEAAEDILLEQDDVNEAVRATAYGLVSTIHRRAQQYTQYMRESEGRVLAERERVAQRDERIAALERRLGNVEVPPGFQSNNGRVSCTVPSAEGLQVVPRYVRRLGDGKVEMLAGREAEESVYVAQLYLTPDYSSPSADPMPPWFLQLLSGPSAGFNVLAAASYALDQWAVHAEVLRYRENDEERRVIETEVAELTSRLAVLQERLDNGRARMEAAEVPRMLRNLEGRADIPRGVRGPPRRGRRIRFNGSGVPF